MSIMIIKWYWRW